MFNPQARWDRNLPQEETQDELFNEPIEMSCLFTKGKPLPRYFVWRDKIYRVKRVNFFWQERQGREILSYFSLQTNLGTYQVGFSNIAMSWKLNRVIST